MGGRLPNRRLTAPFTSRSQADFSSDLSGVSDALDQPHQGRAIQLSDQP
jgi:hypothetical protein